MNTAELKEQIQAVMVKHLQDTIGYPDCENVQIMTQLKPMWIKIEEAGLIQPGMSFVAFAAHAENAYTFAQLMDFMP